MSRRIVGYEGEGKRRRPVYSDPIETDLTGNPPGPVTRRVATDAERGGFASRVQGPGLIRLPRRSPLITPPKAIADAERMQASRLRGAVRHVDVITARRLPAPPVSEEPVMAIEPPPVTPELEADAPAALGTRIAVVAEAAAAASDAWSELQMATQAARAAEAALAVAEVRWDDARTALEASWRSTGIGFAVGPSAWEAERRHEQLLNGDDRPAIVESPSDHSETIPVPDPTSTPSAAFAAFSRDKAAAAGGGPAATKQDRILAAIVPNAGDLRAIAAANHTTPGNVTATLHNAGKRHRLTADMIAVLPAAFARYAGV